MSDSAVPTIRQEARERLLKLLSASLWRSSRDLSEDLGEFYRVVRGTVGVSAPLSMAGMKIVLHEMAREGVIEKRALGAGWKWRLKGAQP